MHALVYSQNDCTAIIIVDYIIITLMSTLIEFLRWMINTEHAIAPWG